MDSTSTRFILSNSTYNTMKWFVQILLPAFSALYFGLAQIWGLPAAEQVVGTIAIVTAFLGALLGISTHQYNASNAGYAGDILVSENVEGKKIFTLSLNYDPEELEDKTSVNFKVMPSPPVSSE